MQRLFTLLTSLLLIGGCDSAPETVSHKFNLFDRAASISAPPGTPPALLQEVEADMRYLAEATHPAQAGPMGRTNTLLGAAGEFSANPSLIAPISTAKALSQFSGGRYNPARGRLHTLWGLHGGEQELPPGDAAITQVLAAAPTMNDVIIDGIRMRSTNPAVQLDLGPVARGLVIDTGAQRLLEAGVGSAQISVGNDVRLLPESKPGLVTVPGIGVQIGLEPGESLFTLHTNPGTGSPVIDPRNGRPLTEARQVWVIADTAANASAQAQALLIAGSEEWPQLRAQMPIDHALLIEQEKTFATGKMQARLKPQPKPLHTLSVKPEAVR